MNAIKTFCCLFILLLLLNCNNDDDQCYLEVIETQYLQDHNDCIDVNENISLSGTSLYYFIDTQEKLEQYIESDCDIEIDFSQFILIAGNSFRHFTGHRLSDLCEENRYDLTFYLDNNSDTDLRYEYFILAPKNEIELQNIEFSISYVYGYE